MPRTPETVKIAKSNLDRSNIAAGKIRATLASAILSARDGNVQEFDKLVDNLEIWVDVFRTRTKKALAE